MPKHEIELLDNTVPAKRTIHGDNFWIIGDGGRLKIQVKMDNSEPMQIVLNEKVPSGKKWKAKVNVVIVEEDK